MSERYRQTILPSDDFAPEAVKQYKQENPNISSSLSDALDSTIDGIEGDTLDPIQLHNARGFLAGVIGFGRKG